MKSIDPGNGRLIQSYDPHTKGEIEIKIETLHSSQGKWSLKDFTQRGSYVLEVAEGLGNRKREFAQLIHDEMGKKISEAEAEIDKCISLCHYYIENAPTLLQNKDVQTELKSSYVSFQPLGIVLAIMPWNFPFWQVFRCAIPAIFSGNTVLLKHASNVTGCSLAIEDVFQTKSAAGLFQSVKVASSEIEPIIADSRISAISLTGSEAAGRSVGVLAGKYLKKSVLELGGSDAYIIDSEVDIDNAIQKTLASRILNSGQSCIGAKRIIVHKDIFDLFTSKFKKELMLYGITNESFHKIAPLARKDLRDEVHQQVSASISEGALLEMGGFIPEGSGYYYPPTLLVNVDEHMTAFKDEIFGPVFSMIQANSWDHAIQLANNTPFGLGAAIFSKDEEKARNAAERIIHSGSCAINDYVRSDPRLPFGGIGVSGFGRELASYGLLEFTNIKTICIGH